MRTCPWTGCVCVCMGWRLEELLLTRQTFPYELVPEGENSFPSQKMYRISFQGGRGTGPVRELSGTLPEEKSSLRPGQEAAARDWEGFLSVLLPVLLLLERDTLHQMTGIFCF